MCWYRLDYPGIGPEHSYLSDIGRAEYYAVTDAEALEAFQHVSRLEGIIPALETSHAFAYLKVSVVVQCCCTKSRLLCLTVSVAAQHQAFSYLKVSERVRAVLL